MISDWSRWLTIAIVLALAVLNPCRTLRAQTLNVAVSSSGDQSLSAGSSFSNGGTITVTASGVPVGATVNITSVTLSVENAALFDSLTLTGSSPGGSQDFTLPLTSGSNDATFSSIQLSDGQSASFVLSGAVSSSPPASTNLSRRQLKNFQRASMSPAGGASMVLVGFIALGLLALSGKLRRRHLVMLAVWMVMAATVVSCGQGGGLSSDQQVTAVSATSGSGSTVTAAGVPADLGTISVAATISSGGVAVPTPTP